jgi:hypothetical protein
MFVAHMTGWSKKSLLKMPVTQLVMWFEEALGLYKQINSTEDNG